MGFSRQESWSGLPFPFPTMVLKLFGKCILYSRTWLNVKADVTDCLGYILGGSSSAWHTKVITVCLLIKWWLGRVREKYLGDPSESGVGPSLRGQWLRLHTSTEVGTSSKKIRKPNRGNSLKKSHLREGDGGSLSPSLYPTVPSLYPDFHFCEGNSLYFLLVLFLGPSWNIIGTQ